eukprot:195514-Chlamydomonas_euryale.AAC.2
MRGLFSRLPPLRTACAVSSLSEVCSHSCPHCAPHARSAAYERSACMRGQQPMRGQSPLLPALIATSFIT